MASKIIQLAEKQIVRDNCEARLAKARWRVEDDRNGPQGSVRLTMESTQSTLAHACIAGSLPADVKDFGCKKNC